MTGKKKTQQGYNSRSLTDDPQLSKKVATRRIDLATEIVLAVQTLDRSPKKNWVEKAGGLDPYLRRIAIHLHENGHSISQSIRMAWGIVRRWGSTGRTKAWGHNAQVSAKTRAKAAAASANMESKRARAKAMSNVVALANPKDLIFYENRSTPQVVPAGAPAKPKKGYGRMTKRRKATLDELKKMTKPSNNWLRVDEHGRTPQSSGYKKTKYRPQLVKASREVQLVKQFADNEFHSPHAGQKCSRWQHTDGKRPDAVACRESGGSHHGACAKHKREMTKSASKTRATTSEYGTLSRKPRRSKEMSMSAEAIMLSSGRVLDLSTTRRNKAKKKIMNIMKSGGGPAPVKNQKSKSGDGMSPAMGQMATGHVKRAASHLGDVPSAVHGNSARRARDGGPASDMPMSTMSTRGKRKKLHDGTKSHTKKAMKMSTVGQGIELGVPASVLRSKSPKTPNSEAEAKSGSGASPEMAMKKANKKKLSPAMKRQMMKKMAKKRGLPKNNDQNRMEMMARLRKSTGMKNKNDMAGDE